MTHNRRLQALTIAGGILVMTAFITIFAAGPSEAQPRFRNFDPPKNPVASSVDHTFEFPGNIQAEMRRGQGRGGTPYSGYVKVYDEHETVSLMIPSEWNDVELDHAVPGDHDSGMKIMAASDLVAFQAGEAPGVILLATSEPADDNAIDAKLDETSSYATGQCGKQRFARSDYVDPFFQGQYDFFSSCSKGFSYLTLVAAPGTGAATITIDAVIQNEADLEAVSKVLESFELLGVPGHDDHHDHDDEHDHEH